MADWINILPEAVKKRWSKFNEVFKAFYILNGQEHDDLRLTEISAALRCIPGIELPTDLTVVGHYHGYDNKGQAEIITTLNGSQVNLADVSRFSMSLDGICAAFFIAHLAPTYGRFWHSLYNHDYPIFFDQSSLVAWLVYGNINPDDGNPLQSLKFRPGFRVSTAGSALRAAALGAGSTTGLTDFMIELADGRLTKIDRQLLIRSNTMILY
jgi:hypothetical protein